MTSIKEAQAFYRLAYNKEDSDCSVRALAVTCAAPYSVAHAAMHFAGRGPSQAANMQMIETAARSLGFSLREIKTESKTLRALCAQLSDEPGAYMAVTADHVVGFWNGECIDWCRDMRLPLKYLLAVVRVK